MDMGGHMYDCADTPLDPDQTGMVDVLIGASGNATWDVRSYIEVNRVLSRSRQISLRTRLGDGTYVDDNPYGMALRFYAPTAVMNRGGPTLSNTTALRFMCANRFGKWRSLASIKEAVDKHIRVLRSRAQEGDDSDDSNDNVAQPAAQPAAQPVVIMIDDDGEGEARRCQVCTGDLGADAVTLQPCRAPMCVGCVELWATSYRGRLMMCSCTHDALQTDHVVMYAGNVLDVLTDEQKASWRAAIARMGSDTMRDCPRCKIKIVTRADARVFICPNVNCTPHPAYGYCKRCLAPINDLGGHSCLTQVDHAALLAAAANPANGFVQPCPGCGNAAQKLDITACNHMTCVVCDVRYCGACRHRFVFVGRSWQYNHDCTSGNMYNIDAAHSAAGIAAALATAHALVRE